MYTWVSARQQQQPAYTLTVTSGRPSAPSRASLPDDSGAISYSFTL